MPLLEFENVPILPYTWLLDAAQPGGTAHCGGPLWPDWDTQVAARHCRRGRPVDVPPAAEPPADTFAEPVAWGGAVVGHFGHQIAEFATRILPTLRDWPDATFAFAVKPGSGIVSPATAPRFFVALLDWFGVPPERVRIVSRPTLAARLLVAPQGEQFGGLGAGVAPAADYLDLLDALGRRRLGAVARRGTVYVSRAAQRTRFAGEAELETALDRAGVEVFRPEDVPLAEQLRRYAGAERLLFAEGSAVHGLQLLGRGLGDVSVLTRRAGSMLAEAALRARARSVRHLDFGVGLIHTVDGSGRPGIHGGLAVLDAGRLVEGLRSLGIEVAPHWDAARFHAACERDAREWLARAWHGPSLAIPGAAGMIRASLAACGFAHLIAEMNETVARRRLGQA